METKRSLFLRFKMLLLCTLFSVLLFEFVLVNVLR